MLTEKEITKTARLMTQVGEPRPGYVRDALTCLEGPSSGADTYSMHDDDYDGPSITLVFEKDKSTGGTRLVLK